MGRRGECSSSAGMGEPGAGARIRVSVCARTGTGAAKGTDGNAAEKGERTETETERRSRAGMEGATGPKEDEFVGSRKVRGEGACAADSSEEGWAGS